MIISLPGAVINVVRGVNQPTLFFKVFTVVEIIPGVLKIVKHTQNGTVGVHRSQWFVTDIT